MKICSTTGSSKHFGENFYFHIRGKSVLNMERPVTLYGSVTQYVVTSVSVDPLPVTHPTVIAVHLEPLHKNDGYQRLRFNISRIF
jgi:hypothetical protein